jgi:TldD protein
MAAAAGAAVVGAIATPSFLSALDRYPRAGDPALKDLAAKALDAAKAAGATYADVRFTLTRSEELQVGRPGAWYLLNNNEHGAAGVRALADGAWGFAASNVWSADEAARLGREATVQAKTNARGRRRRVEIGDPPPLATGEWKTSIRRDPFLIPLNEKLDVLWALAEVASRMDVNVSVSSGTILRQRRQEKTFSSTDGSFLVQTLYFIDPEFSISATAANRSARLRYNRLQPAAAGWELVADQTLVRDIPPVVEEVIRMLDAEPVDPDRYDIVCDGYTTANLVGYTIGVAAELDRVLGYEANAVGTSYLAPPTDMLGKYTLGPSWLNVSANRSRSGGLATVKWDDEGFVPDDYRVITDGVLVDYHTTRELATALGAQRKSHGCAGSENALSITTLQTPNIEMHPGPAETSFDELISGLEKGLVIVGGRVTIDRQQLNGEINAQEVYEVRNGKRTRYIRNSELLFRAPELWKGLQAIGGPKSQVFTGVDVDKGQPNQNLNFGVGAVPARFHRVSVTDRSSQA